MCDVLTSLPKSSRIRPYGRMFQVDRWFKAVALCDRLNRNTEVGRYFVYEVPATRNVCGRPAIAGYQIYVEVN